MQLLLPVVVPDKIPEVPVLGGKIGPSEFFLMRSHIREHTFGRDSRWAVAALSAPLVDISRSYLDQHDEENYLQATAEFCLN
jgi:hypothetical protein